MNTCTGVKAMALRFILMIILHVYDNADCSLPSHEKED